MAITLNDLTVNFDHLDRARLLEDWTWLIGPSKVPILLLAAGDAFLQDASDGSVHLLDVGAGRVSRVADDVEAFRAALGDRGFVTSHFAIDMILALRRSGLVLDPGEIYSFPKPPVLGGEYAIENFEKSDIEVHFALLGQIHEKVKDLPPGASIDSIRIT